MDLFQFRDELLASEEEVITQVGQQNYELWRSNIILLRAVKRAAVSDSLAFAANNRIAPVLDVEFSDLRGDPFSGHYDVEGPVVLEIVAILDNAERKSASVSLQQLQKLTGTEVKLIKTLKYISIAHSIDQAEIARLINSSGPASRLWSTAMPDHDHLFAG